MTTETPKWRAESVPDEYSTQDRVWYSVATSELDMPVLYFDDEQNAVELADYLNALEARVARAEAKAALADDVISGERWFRSDVHGCWCDWCGTAGKRARDLRHIETCPVARYDALDQGAQEETTTND